MTIAKIAAKIRVAVMVKPNDFSSSFNTLMVVRLAFRELGQLLLRLQVRRCGHGSAVRVSWVHINPISARINAGKLAGHSLTTARLFSRTARILFQRFDIEPTHGDRGTLRRPSIDCAADQHQLDTVARSSRRG
jgi:hypothetical protein